MKKDHLVTLSRMELEALECKAKLIDDMVVDTQQTMSTPFSPGGGLKITVKAIIGIPVDRADSIVFVTENGKEYTYRRVT